MSSDFIIIHLKIGAWPREDNVLLMLLHVLLVNGMLRFRTICVE